MAKHQTKSNRSFWILVGGGSLVLGAVFFPGGGDAPKITHKAKPKSSLAKKDDFLPIDYKAKFVSLNESARDTFTPLVMKQNAGAGGLNGLPGSLTGGEGNWMYSGNVSVNGTSQALVENSQSGEGVYLEVGQHWKTTTVKSIGENYLVLEGPDGPIRLELGQSGEPAKNGDALAPARVASPLSGPIGAGLQITPVGPGAQPPLAAATAAPAPDAMAAQPNPNNMSRRRGRRNFQGVGGDGG